MEYRLHRSGRRGVLAACLATTVLATSAAAASRAQSLVIGYNQRPPYHYQVGDDPTPRGLIADVLLPALRDAGLPAHFVPMSGDRIMAEMKREKPFCSFSWFRTPDRLTFATFSAPLWRDPPFVAVFKSENRGRLARHATLAELFRDPGVRFGTKSRTSYGDQIDALVRGAGSGLVDVANEQENMLRMLDRARFDFLLLVPTEIDALFQAAGVDPHRFDTASFPDIPPGNTRHLMCNLSVDPSVIRRLDAAIRDGADRKP